MQDSDCACTISTSHGVPARRDRYGRMHNAEPMNPEFPLSYAINRPCPGVYLRKEESVHLGVGVTTLGSLERKERVPWDVDGRDD